MTTLRQIHDKLTPTVNGWPDEIMEEFNAAIEPYPPAQQKALLKLASEAVPLLSSGNLIFRTISTDGSGEAREDAVAKAWKMVAEQMNGDMGAAYHVLHILYRKSTTPELAHTFHRSLLVSAVAALDVLILELISNFYLVHPEALGNESTFTLADLSHFSDMTDARMAAVEEKADGILRKGLEGWQKWLKEQKIDLKNHCADFGNLVEIIQRRHVAVHNDGKVSHSYQTKLRQLANLESPAIGTPLPIDSEYFESALDELESVGNLLAGAVWTKCLGEAEDIVIYELFVRTYDLMLADRWVPTACICSMALKRLKSDDDLYLIHKVNAWLARKRMGEDISDEVRGWPTKVLSPRFQAAKAALLDNFEQVDVLLRKCLKSDDLGMEDALEWPVFAEFREQELWQHLVDSEPEK